MITHIKKYIILYNTLEEENIYMCVNIALVQNSQYDDEVGQNWGSEKKS